MLRDLLTRLRGLRGLRGSELPADPFGDPPRDRRVGGLSGTAADATRYQPVTDLPAGGSPGS